MSYAKQASREELIAGLRDLAGYLKANPDLPTPFNIGVMAFPDRDRDAAICTEIDHVAELLGSKPIDERTEHGHHSVARSLGPVTYSAVAILADRARHDAHMSYHGSVIPETGMTQEGR